MGGGGSKEKEVVTGGTAEDTGSACPVRGKSSATASATAAATESCPVQPGSGMLAKYRSPKAYNVYSQELDPSNQMPANANQAPAPGQTAPLSTSRVESGIPKGGTDSTWTYPSPQMFYNAIVRKGKKGTTGEQDMDMVVAIHNNMNERTWKQVLAWEDIHLESDAEEKGTAPRLLRFLGRPDDFSPLARLKMLFGHPAPFDRHDWVVDRGGREVRYVIDYYHDVSKSHMDTKPGLRDESSVKSIVLDVRPALDSPEAFMDRYLRMPLALAQGATRFSPSPFFASQAMIEADRRDKEAAAQEEKQRVAAMEKHSRGRRLPAPIAESCGSLMRLVQTCEGQEQCTERLVGFELCAARIVAPDLAKLFEASYAEGNDQAMQTNYEKMSAATSTWLQQYTEKVAATSSAAK